MRNEDRPDPAHSSGLSPPNSLQIIPSQNPPSNLKTERVTCPTCGNEKSPQDFHKKGDRYESTCKVCSNLRKKRSREAKKRIAERSKRKYRFIQEFEIVFGNEPNRPAVIESLKSLMEELW